MPLIEIRELAFSYPNGIQALRGVNLTIEDGESVGIVGRNGSGKTTLVKHFNALFTPQSGSVLVEGQRTVDREPADLAAIIGLVFQNPSDQIFKSRVWDEVAFGVRQLGFDGSELESRVSAALAMIDLEWAADDHPYDLTLTDRKLICLASILAGEPKIVVLDEPTTAQDQQGVLRLLDIIHQLLDQGRTVITITHDMDFVAEAFERTVAMRDGQIILDGPTTEVFRQPEVLETTYVKPPAMSRLGQHLGIADSILTTDAMADWVDAAKNSATKYVED